MYCFNNKLTSLDVSKNTALTDLYCGNKLTSLDERPGNINRLTSLDVSNNTALTTLYCGGNKFDCDSLIAKFGLNKEY